MKNLRNFPFKVMKEKRHDLLKIFQKYAKWKKNVVQLILDAMWDVSD